MANAGHAVLPQLLDFTEDPGLDERTTGNHDSTEAGAFFALLNDLFERHDVAIALMDIKRSAPD